MNNMATTISGLKVNSQMYKCFYCGRKTVSLQNDSYVMTKLLQNVNEDGLLDTRELLDNFKNLNEEWLATCQHCGWSDT